MDIFFNPEKLQQFMSGLGVWAPALFFVIQLIQVVLAPVPGGATTLAGAAMFGFWPAFLMSSTAIILATAVCFMIGRKAGLPALRKILGEAKVEKYEHLLSDGSARLNVFTILFFILPFLPKDMFCYLLGLTPMKMRTFIVISIFTRPWGLLTASLLGSGVLDMPLAAWIILLSVLAAAGFFAFRYAQQLEDFMMGVIHKVLDKMKKKDGQGL